jgi:hypothetical protein
LTTSHDQDILNSIYHLINPLQAAIQQSGLTQFALVNRIVELDFDQNMMYNCNVYMFIVHYQREKYGSNAGLSNGGRKKQP